MAEYLKRKVFSLIVGIEHGLSDERLIVVWVNSLGSTIFDEGKGV